MLNSFIEYITIEKRYSEHTSLAYRKDIEQFLDYADITKTGELKEVDSRLIRGWIVDLMESDNTARTVNRKLSSLRTYFKWLMKEGQIDSTPMATLQGPKNEKRLPHFAQKNDLSAEKMNELFEDDFEGARDRLMLEFFYQTGIRLSELINLRDGDVSGGQIKVLGKRNKERIIPITPYLNGLIKTYLIKRQELDRNTDHFFVLNNGNKLYPKLVYRKINFYLGEATNLEKKSPHVLRHTFATHMLNNGAGLEVLKELLGHANLSATQVYTHNSFAELTKVYSQSHPRGRKN